MRPGADDVGQRAPSDKGHHEPEIAAMDEGTVQRQKIGVPETLHHLRFLDQLFLQ